MSNNRQAVDEIRAELERIGAGGDDGIEVESHSAGARFYDTQETAIYDSAAALRGVPSGEGFAEAWNALVHLEEVRS
jgi:hypothetical protein